MITWEQRRLNLEARLGRKPLLSELLEEAKHHTLTEQEQRVQAESWARANVSIGDPRWD